MLVLEVLVVGLVAVLWFDSWFVVVVLLLGGFEFCGSVVLVVCFDVFVLYVLFG